MDALNLTLSGARAFGLLAISLICGLGLLLWGGIGVWLAPVTKRAIRAWRRRWGAPPTVSDETIRESLRVLVRLRAWGALFGGLAILVVLGLYVGLTLAIAGVDTLLNYQPFLWLLAWYALVFICVCVGQVLAAVRMRLRTRGQPRHASLRPRRLSLYLSAWYGRVVLGLAVATFVATLAALPFLRSPLRNWFLVDSPGSSLAPLGLATVFVLPIAFLGVVALQRYGVRLLVDLPDLGGDLAAPEARLVDFTYRLESISGLSGLTLELIITLPAFQWFFLLENVTFASAVLNVLAVVPMLLLVPAMIVMAVLNMAYYERAPARFYEYESHANGGRVA